MLSFGLGLIIGVAGGWLMYWFAYHTATNKAKTRALKLRSYMMEAGADANIARLDSLFDLERDFEKARQRLYKGQQP